MSKALPDWLTENSPYAGNANAFTRLRKAIGIAQTRPLSPRIICFAGAGCSMPLLPGWESLLLGMRDDLQKKIRFDQQKKQLEKLPRPADMDGGYLEFADALKMLADSELFSSALKEHLTLPKSAQRFRRTHAAIACMNIDGIVTTNFDFCLSDAQTTRLRYDRTWHHCRLEASYDVGLTSGARERINAWLMDDNGEFRFGGETNSPLYLHGSLQAPRGVVISATDYGRFYDFGAMTGENAGAFFLEQLAGVASLLFVGYSFSDPFINTVLARVADRPVWWGNHFALLGVEDSQLPDLDSRTRSLLKMKITPIYYPITAIDHPALQQLLDALDCYDSKMVDEIAAAAAPMPPAANLAGAFRGEGPIGAMTTIIIDNAQEWAKLPKVDPDQLIERATEIKQLDEFASNIKVRIICICGLGGTGKTTLLRRVLEDKTLSDARFPDGIIVSPIRDDAQADTIIDTLCDTFPPETPLDRNDRAAKLRHAEQVLRLKRLLLVLDGAELLQERPGQSEHGRFLSDDLRTLLLSAARDGHSLVAITSRFAPVEFQAFKGASYRTIDLGGFTLAETVSYLTRAGVKGNRTEMAEAHQAFQGHPLGLALFAGAITGEKSSVFANGEVHAALEILRSATTLDERLTAILDWYQRDLSPIQIAMLTLLAVYPTSVSHKELLALLRSECVRSENHSVTIEEGQAALASLQVLKLIQFDADQERYECHAIVRQAMRRRDPAIAQAAIISLTGDAPAFNAVETVEELQRVVDAIEIAIESLGDFRRANSLLVTRLKSGDSFFELGVPQIGMSTLARIVSDDPWQNEQTRRQAAEAVIGKRATGAYVHRMRQFHEWFGNLAEAERYRQIDGDHYIDWSQQPKRDNGQIQFWIDGADIARRSINGPLIRHIRIDTYKRYGYMITECIKQKSIFIMDDILELSLKFVDINCPNSNDPWNKLAPTLLRRCMESESIEFTQNILNKIRSSISIFIPSIYNTPSGEYKEHFLDIDSNIISDRRDRFTTSLRRLQFLDIAKAPLRPGAIVLFEMARLLRTRESGEWQALEARALQCLADELDRVRNGPGAALARSWAAEKLIYIGHAESALDWSNRALDNCIEDRLERSRALYMRGKANLALGHFDAAIEDAQATGDITREAESPFYFAGSLSLRWLAAEQALDPRAEGWKHEKDDFFAKVYLREDYDRIPDFDVLPGESGFHDKYPNLDLADDILSATPSSIEIIKAIIGGYFEDLRQQYRGEILKL